MSECLIPNNYTALDLETTGLSLRTERIIEVGAVRVREGCITDRFSLLINPGTPMDPRVTELTGITDEVLLQAPPIKDVMPEILSFIGDDLLLGHKISFDYGFLKKEAQFCHVRYIASGIDTLEIARRLLPSATSKKLPDLCAAFHIPQTAHRAASDAEAAHLLYQHFLHEFSEADPAIFAPKPLFARIKKDGPASAAQLERLRTQAVLHHVILREDLSLLSKSQVSRLTDLILSGNYPGQTDQ